MGKGRIAAGLAVNDAGSGHAVVGTTVALAGMGFFVLLNGHDILLKKLYSLGAPGYRAGSFQAGGKVVGGPRKRAVFQRSAQYQKNGKLSSFS